MSIYVGIIAEETNDVDVIEEIIAKIKRRNLFKVKKFVGHSCGKLRNKCRDWAYNLHIQKCKILILVHDLDENNLGELKASLELSLIPSPIKNYLIVIPVREIEAWLLADHNAINLTFNLKLKKIPNPESIRRPKEYLRDIVYLRSNKKRNYTNTIHNRKIAANAHITMLNRCDSFKPLNKFLRNNL